MSSSIGPSPRLSIVIPAADAASLEDTLVSVLERRPADCEIIVALSVPYDDPWNIAEEVRFVQAPAGTGLVGRVNVGVASSRGDVVHILAAGSRATDGWTDAAIARFDEPTVAAVVPVGVHTSDRGRVVTAGIRRTAGGRSVLIGPPKTSDRLESFRPEAVATPSAPALEAGFWRADVLRNGGFASACGDELAAADMAATLSCAGYAVVLEPQCRVVWGSTPKRSPAFLAGMHAELLFWRSLPAQAVIPALASHTAEVVRHAAASAPLGTIPMLLGRLMALVQFGRCIPRTKQLRSLLAQRSHTRPPQPRTVRIDAGHSLPSRPRRASESGVVRGAQPSVGETPLRRSA